MTSDAQQRDGGGGAEERAPQRTLQAAGVTLLGVLGSIGVTVAFGITGPWWLRLLVGAGTAAGLILLVGFLGRRTPLLTRFADWLMHLPE